MFVILCIDSSKSYNDFSFQKVHLFKTTIIKTAEKSLISGHPANMPLWVPYGLPIWGVQPGLAWVPYGLAHMRVAQMGPIWVPYNSPIKKKEML